MLRKLDLKVTTVDDLWVFTGVTNDRGVLVDTCEGDSGGPLLSFREGGWELVGTLQVVYKSRGKKMKNGESFYTIMNGDFALE